VALAFRAAAFQAVDAKATQSERRTTNGLSVMRLQGVVLDLGIGLSADWFCSWLLSVVIREWNIRLASSSEPRSIPN
jgi:hypothetical protein